MVKSIPTMYLNTNFHLTLKLEMLKVLVKDKWVDGGGGGGGDYANDVAHQGVHMHVKFERIIISSFPTMDLNTVAKPNH